MAKRGSNIYKRKDGRFEGRVSVGYKENGKTKYRYVYGHSLAEVKEKMAQVYSGKNTQEQSKNKMIVRDIAEQWLAEKKLTVKAASYTSYRNLLNNHIYPEFGGIRYTALTKQMLNRYMSELLVSGREDGSGGLSVKTVRDVIVVLKSVDRIYWKNVKETFKNVISALTEREQKVIRLKYGLSLCGKHSVKEIADMFYVDKERIISIEEKALRKLKRNEEIRKLWKL